MSCERTTTGHISNPARSRVVMSEHMSNTQFHRNDYRRALLGVNQVGVFVALLFSSSFFLLPSVAHSASYVFSPASGSHGVGESFTVRVMVNAGSDAVNTGDGTITYDKDKLTAQVSKEGSPFNLWVTEPSVKASDGTITFAGGGTTPISGSKAIMTITFKGKAEGDAAISFAKGTLLAGAGKNALSGDLPEATYTITPAAAKPPPEPAKPTTPTRTVNIPPPDAPIITCASHPDEAAWYPQRNIRCSWDLPYGVIGLKMSFDDKPDTTPSELYEPPIGELSKDKADDGIYYLHVIYKNRGGWGTSTTFKLSVDGTPPEEFSAEAVGGDLTAQVRFEAKDALSGIALYRVGVDGGRTRDVQLNELVGGGYTITNMDPGEHTITVIAVDHAGNERETGTSVVVTGTKVSEEEEVKTSGFGPIYWVSLLFMAALAIVITMLIKERRAFHEEKDHIKREAMEAGDKLINIFGVLRDEIEEKVLELSHKPNMTDNERRILEALKDALDISEELIDKEIEDVRKLLK